MQDSPHKPKQILPKPPMAVKALRAAFHHLPTAERGIAGPWITWLGWATFAGETFLVHGVSRRLEGGPSVWLAVPLGAGILSPIDHKEVD